MQQIQFLVWTQIWQIAFAFVLIWCATRWIRHKRPHFALVLWGLFFIKCIVPPVLLAPIGIFAWQTPDFESQTAMVPNSQETNVLVEKGSIERSQPTESLQTTQWTKNLLTSSNSLLIFWWIGSASFLLISALYFAKNRSEMHASQEPLQDWMDDIGNEVFSTTGLDLMNRQLIVTKNVPLGPVVFGFFRPVICVSESLLRSPTLTRIILAHESCHLWRRDHWLGVLQFIVQAIFWFHPAVWLASRETNRLCEVCCDDDTLRLFNLPSRGYARGLLDVLEYQRDLKAIHWFPGIRPVEITKDRIRRILSGDVRIRFRGRLFAVAFLLALLIFPAGGTSQWAIGIQDWGQWTSESPDLPVAEFSQVSDDAHRQEMNFLIGQWSVQTEQGDEVGQSKFLMERSGNMIREEWTSVDGDTAQGITYYDPNKNCWVLTWVDGSGTIMESKGRWTGRSLQLSGLATRKDGATFRVRTSMFRESEHRIRMDMFVDQDGELRQISKIFYCR